MSDQDSAPTAAVEILPARPRRKPKHGHGTLTPWQPGQSGNPAGNPRGRYSAEVLRIVREASPEAMRQLVKLATGKRVDQRVRVVAIDKLYAICQFPKQEIDDRPRPDLSALTPKELEQFAKLLGKAAKAGGFPAPTTDGGTDDGKG